MALEPDDGLVVLDADLNRFDGVVQEVHAVTDE